MIGLAGPSNALLPGKSPRFKPPPPNQHELGGYETWLGTSRVREDASVLIIDQLLGMLAELKEERE